MSWLLDINAVLVTLAVFVAVVLSRVGAAIARHISVDLDIVVAAAEPSCSTKDSRRSIEIAIASSTSSAGLRADSLRPKLVESWEASLKLSAAEEKVIFAFRARLQEEGLLPARWDDKPNLYRWCVARKFDLGKALQMYRAHIDWRREQGIGLDDEVHHQHLGPVARKLVDVYVFPELARVKKAYPHAYHKTDKSGRMVYYDCAGKLDVKALLGVSTIERLTEWFIWELEMTQHVRLPSCSLAAGRYMPDFLVVLDLDGFSIASFNADARRFLGMITKLCSDNYPETMSQMVIVNTPWVFRTVWAFVAPMLNQRTREKISMLGGLRDFRPVLLKLIDAQSLPTFLGGTDTTCDFVHDQGPWAHVLPDVSRAPSERSL